MWLLADALGADIDEVTSTVEAVAARHDHQIFDYLLAAGTTDGQRWNWVGVRDGEPLIEIEPCRLTSSAWPASPARPRMAEHVRVANVATAMQVLNAVPEVCDVEPGFATLATPPLIYSHNGFRR